MDFMILMSILAVGSIAVYAGVKWKQSKKSDLPSCCSGTCCEDQYEKFKESVPDYLESINNEIKQKRIPETLRDVIKEESPQEVKVKASPEVLSVYAGKPKATRKKKDAWPYPTSESVTKKVTKRAPKPKQK